LLSIVGVALVAVSPVVLIAIEVSYRRQRTKTQVPAVPGRPYSTRVGAAPFGSRLALEDPPPAARG